MMAWPAPVPELVAMARQLDLEARRVSVCAPTRAAELRQEAAQNWAQVESIKAATIADEINGGSWLCENGKRETTLRSFIPPIGNK
jgi:hypothetical protein